MHAPQMRVISKIAIAFLLSRASAAPEHAVRGGMLQVAQRAELKSFNPVTAIDAPSREVLWGLDGDLLPSTA